MTAVVALFDRYPFNSPWIRAVIGRYGLPFWFAANSFWGLVGQARDTSLLFFDARLYLTATDVWLHGGDPWSVSLMGNHFAAPPPSLLPLVPFALLPQQLAVPALAAAVIVAGIASIRLLRLPWWWILFPPLVQCMLSANTNALVLPLILVGAGPLAVLFKVYGIVPLAILDRRREVLATIVILIATIPILPWATYVQSFGEINGRLQEQTHFALPTLVLIAVVPVALLAMRIVGRERAAWLAVPALWPSQQYYYGSLAIGARSGLAAAIVAFPINGSGLYALLILAAVTWWRSRAPERGTAGPTEVAAAG